MLFDAGRNSTTGLARLAIDPVAISKIFLTHLHSDHIISLPELLLFPWTSGRTTPLSVWGPVGTRAMMQNLQEAFTVDIHARRDEEARFSTEGIQVLAHDISGGLVYQSNGVQVRAFRVDHGPGVAAFGYRVDFQGRSVAVSGDTRPTENLVKVASGVDVLIHSFGRRKDDPVLTGPLDEVLPNGRTRRQQIAIVQLHTDGVEVGKVLNQVKPRLAVFSHYQLARKEEVSLVRENYSGPLEFGEDLMTIDIGRQVNVRRFVPPSR